MTGVCREIVEPERLVFISATLDAEGNPLFGVLTSVTFAEQSGKTKLTLQAHVITVRGPTRPPRISREWKRAGPKVWNVSPHAWRRN